MPTSWPSSLMPGLLVEGSFSEYEENRKKRLGGDIVPLGIKAPEAAGTGLLPTPASPAARRR